MKNNAKPKKPKAIYKIGEEVFDNDNDQLTNIVAINFDENADEYAYTVKCQDTQQINLTYESQLDYPATDELTMKELENWYFEETSKKLKIIK